MKLRFLAVVGITIVLPSNLSFQERPGVTPQSETPSAIVEVMAFDTYGNFLGAPEISTFESQEGQNLAAKFRAGVADGIPFGLYRIKGVVLGHASAVRFVRVFRSRTSVVLGLPIGVIAEEKPNRLRGRVVGVSFDTSKRPFARLTGVFSGDAVESVVGPDQNFDLVGATDGLFLLTIVSEDGVLANRVIRLPYRGPPLEIEIGSDVPTLGR